MLKKLRNDAKNFITVFIDCVKSTFYLIYTNFKQVLLFILLNIFINLFVVKFITDVARDLLYIIGDTSHIGSDNMGALFLSPVFIGIIIIYGIALAYVAVFEAAALFYAFSMSRIGKKATITSMVMNGLITCRKIVQPRNYLIIPFVVILLPFTGIINLSSAGIKVLLPGFIESFILDNLLYSTLLLIVYIILTIIVLSDIFAFNFFALGDDNFWPSCKKSKALMKGRYKFIVGSLILFSIIFYLIITSCSATGASIIIKIKSFFTGDDDSIISETYSIAVTLQTMSEYFTGVVLPMLDIAALSSLFFMAMDRDNRLDELSERVIIEEKPTIVHKIIVIIALSIIVVYNIKEIIIEIPIMWNPACEIVEVGAHRGDSKAAPENTMPAFELAVSELVDWIELDVHETKDGVIIVSHDDDLKRVSGKDVAVHELTYAETQELEVGSWFSQKYKGLKLSTLDEVLKMIKDSETYVQIEIKPTEFDFEIEEKILKVINDNDMHDRVVILSLKEEPLIRMKELDKTITTCYCMAFAWGDIQEIEFADLYSVEENNVSPRLVNNIHNAKKQCFAWTVNNESTVQYLVDCGIDCILTDDPIMMENTLSKCEYNSGFRKFFNLLGHRILVGY